MLMQGRNVVLTDTNYRYGFNGKENDNEGKGIANEIDYGSRVYDPRVGRFLSIDPLQSKYPELTPYNFVANTPIRGKDPDGKVIIFINGFYSSLTGPCGSCGGTMAYWDAKWIQDAKNQIQDQSARYYDGSVGGLFSTIGSADPVPLDNSTFDLDARKTAGYNQGKLDAADIVNHLQRDANGNITESIKYVTNSMGAAYQRGMSQAIAEYVEDVNATIRNYNQAANEINTELAAQKKAHPNDKKIQRQQPMKTYPELNVKQEFNVDLEPFQGNQLPADPNSQENYFMLSDGEGDGGVIDGIIQGAAHAVVGSAVEGATQIGIDSKGKTMMHGHHSSYAPAKSLPKSNAGTNNKSDKENPSN